MVFWNNGTLGTIQYVYNCTPTEIIVGGVRPWLEVVLLILVILCLITSIIVAYGRLRDDTIQKKSKK